MPSPAEYLIGADASPIGVWCCPADAISPAVAHALCQRWCDPAELTPIARLRRPEERHLRRVSRVLTRHALALYTGRKEHELSFERDRDGRPRLRGGGADFNLSHGGGWAAVACGPQDVRVGIDVESLSALGSATASLEHDLHAAFTASEAAAIAVLPASERPLAALRLWTLKEAVVKATGSGLRRPLNALEVRIDRPEVTLARAPAGEPVRDWRLRLASPAPGVSLALAVRAQQT